MAKSTLGQILPQLEKIVLTSALEEASSTTGATKRPHYGDFVPLISSLKERLDTQAWLRIPKLNLLKATPREARLVEITVSIMATPTPGAIKSHQAIWAIGGHLTIVLLLQVSLCIKRNS